MRQASSILKNTTVLMGGNILSKALGAVLVILLARYLGDAGFGEYSFAFSFVTVFIIISDFGLDALVIRDVSRKKELAGQYLEHIGILRLLLSMIMIIVSLGAGILLDVGNESLSVILFAGLIYAFDKLAGLNFAFFRAFERMEFEALTRVAWRIIQIVLVLAVTQFGYSLTDIMAVLLSASVIKTIISFTMVLKMGVRPTREGISLKKIAWSSRLFAAYEVGYAIYTNIIIIILYIYLSSNEVGWFSASYRIFVFLLIIPTAFETAIYPVLSRLYAEHPRSMKLAYAKSMKFSLLIAIPSTFIISIFSEEIISIFGVDFRNAAEILTIIVFVLPLTTLNMIMKTTLWSSDRTGITVGNIFASAIVLLAVTVYLIGEYGHMGAVYAFIIGEAVLFAANYYYISRYIYKIGKYIWRPAISGSAMLGIIYFLFMVSENRFGLQPLLAAALAGYILLIFALKTITPDDWLMLGQVVRRARRKPR